MSLRVYRCPACGTEMPDAAIYRDYHAEHCPAKSPEPDE